MAIIMDTVVIVSNYISSKIFLLINHHFIIIIHNFEMNKVANGESGIISELATYRFK